MKNLSVLLASELSKKLSLGNESAKRSYGTKKTSNDSLNDQVLLQLNSVPSVIDVNEYKNAQSSANPNGNYRAAYQFSLLVDTVPLVRPTYVDSLKSVSKIWGNIVNSATGLSKYSQTLLDNAQSSYNLSKLSGFGGIPEEWFNIVAKPSNWSALLDNDSNLLEVEIDLINGDITSNDFLILSGDSNLIWMISDKEKICNEVPLSNKSKITKIYLSLLKVDIYRPWLNFEILSSQYWKVEGLDRGYFSNGSLYGNTGNLPLIPQSILFGSKIRIEGNFDSDDIDVITNCKVGNIISLGAFALNNSLETPHIEKVGNSSMILSSNVKQILGYVSRLVPECPGVSGV